MNRKIRHPYQILNISELIVGNNYCFISDNPKTTFLSSSVYVGVIEDSLAAASKNGCNLNTTPNSVLTCSVFTDPAIIDTTWIIKNKLTLNMFTIHFDCWMPNNLFTDDSTLVYWEKNGTTAWDYMSTFLGKTELKGNTHCIIVPQKNWNDDQRIHVRDWENPDCVIERANINTIENAVNWEKKMRAKKHTAMAKALGF
jgi:hypothetical protein